MKRILLPAVSALALFGLVILLVVCLVRFAFAPAPSAPEPDAPALTLDEALLSLLGGDNAAVKQARGGSCYAEVTPRGYARVTYFSPYLSFQFAPAREGEETWLAGGAEGSYEENPFADSLRVRELELCEEIEPDTPSLDGQPSLRQLFRCEEPVTYELLCAALGQTPELRYIDLALYDGAFVSDDSGADADSGRNHRVGDQIAGGQDRAEFKVDDLRLTVDFLRAEDGTLLAFHVMLRRA